MLFANQRIRTPLTGDGKVAVFQVVVGDALVASGVVVFEYGEGEAGEAVHMHLIRGQPNGGADGIVASKFHVRQWTSQSSCLWSTTFASILVMVWLTRPTPPLPLGW